VHGYGNKVGDTLSRHPDVPIISFTGGTATGEKIAKVAAPMFKKLSLELGGKNPNIIFEDAEFENAVKMSVKAAFSNQGQICLCGSRLFVQESIYDAFKSAIIDETKTLKVGDPKDEDSNLGAIVSKPHMEKILKCIDIAKKEGGEILTGGKRIILEGNLKDGYYIEPTIIDGLSADCKTNHEEIFGPVVSMIPFKTEEEVIEMES
jgi:aminomuconate-semialdehyde/2-hydroxymuconate-6-semialdehyde dehydrogenase